MRYMMFVFSLVAFLALTPASQAQVSVQVGGGGILQRGVHVGVGAGVHAGIHGGFVHRGVFGAPIHHGLPAHAFHYQAFGFAPPVYALPSAQVYQAPPRIVEQPPRVVQDPPVMVYPPARLEAQPPIVVQDAPVVVQSQVLYAPAPVFYSSTVYSSSILRSRSSVVGGGGFGLNLGFGLRRW